MKLSQKELTIVLLALRHEKTDVYKRLKEATNIREIAKYATTIVQINDMIMNLEKTYTVSYDENWSELYHCLRKFEIENMIASINPNTRQFSKRFNARAKKIHKAIEKLILDIQEAVYDEII